MRDFTKLLKCATHRGLADPDASARKVIFAHLIEGRIGSVLKDRLKGLKALGVDARARAALIGLGFEATCVAVTLEPVLDGRKANTETTGELALGTFAIFVRLDHTDTEVIGVRFHGRATLVSE